MNTSTDTDVSKSFSDSYRADLLAYLDRQAYVLECCDSSNTDEEARKIRRWIKELKESQSGPNWLGNLDGQDFYELCYRYRHARDGWRAGVGLPTAVEAFEDIKTFIRTGKLPFESYEDAPSATPCGESNG